MRLPSLHRVVQIARPRLRIIAASVVVLLVALTLRLLFAAPVPRQAPESRQPQPKGYLGLSFTRDLTASDAAEFGLSAPMGVVVSRVAPQGPAAVAGVHVEDVVVRLNGTAVENGRSFVALVEPLPPTSRVTLTLIRNGVTVTVPITLAPLEARHDSPDAVPPTMTLSPAEASNDPTGFGAFFDSVSPGLVPRGLVGGAAVKSVIGDSPAHRAGLFAGDVFLRINGRPVSTVAAVIDALRLVPSGHSARVVYWRGGPGGDERLVFLRKP